MRASNKLVRDWLLENKFDDIWFKPHSKRNDLVFTQNGNYLATDLWNLFDGICFDKFGNIRFLQMKTNKWAKEDKMKLFIKTHAMITILSFNINNKLSECKGHYKVFVRELK